MQNSHIGHNKEVNLSSFIYLLNAMIQSNLDSTVPLNDSLKNYGKAIGGKILERISFEDEKNKKFKKLKRIHSFEEAVKFIAHRVWPYLFSKKIDSVGISPDQNDVYILTDENPILDHYISGQKKFNFTNMSFVAGIVEKIMSDLMFPVEITVAQDNPPSQLVQLWLKPINNFKRL